MWIVSSQIVRSAYFLDLYPTFYSGTSMAKSEPEHWSPGTSPNTLIPIPHWLICI